MLVPPVEIILRYFDFNEKNALTSWEHKVFQGRVAYWVDFEDGSARLPASSGAPARRAGRAGIHSFQKQGKRFRIFYRIKFDVIKYPRLSWKWRIGKFPDKTQTKEPKQKDDFAARVYVVFITRFFQQFQIVWNTFGTSRYLKERF